MRYSTYGKENDNLRQYIIWFKGYDPNDKVNEKMQITRHDDDNGYLLTYSRNKYEIRTSNGLYYDPIYISKKDYNECIKNGIIKFLRKEKLLKLNVL